MTVYPFRAPYFPVEDWFRLEAEARREEAAIQRDVDALFLGGSPLKAPWRTDSGPIGRAGRQAWARAEARVRGFDPKDRAPGSARPPAPGAPWEEGAFLPPSFDAAPSAGAQGEELCIPRGAFLQARPGYVTTLSTDVQFATGRGDVDQEPYRRRILLAWSPDGLEWRHLELIVADRADVPCLIVAQGAVWIFFVVFDAQASSDGAEINSQIVCGWTYDLLNWSFHTLAFNWDDTPYTAEQGTPPVDPSVVWDEAGQKYRMYFTTRRQGASGPATWSATAERLSDFTWTVEDGARWGDGSGQAEDDWVMDPNVLWVDDHFELFAGAGAGGNHHAWSEDGLNFEPVGDGWFEAEDEEGGNVLMSNGVQTSDGGTRWYGFSQVPGGDKRIVSLAPISGPSRDRTVHLLFSGWPSMESGSHWAIEEGFRLEVNPSSLWEHSYVADPAVAWFAQGCCWVMAYSTEIPP